MAETSATVVLNTTVLDRLIALLPGRTLETTESAANDIVADIRAHWSGLYPPASSPGQTPAIRSGTLDTSIQATPNELPGQVSVTVEASAPYASDLEYGTVNMAARPFIRPALIWGEQTFGKRFTGVLKP